MDTQTVLEIIKMIDAKIKHNDDAEFIRYDMEYHCADAQTFDNLMFIQNLALAGLRDHLQEYIENRVSAMEQSTPE